ncbi:MAG: fumarylacetoacetate hydrolase family protein [Fimbriimonadaceae bacterium]|nr:fumarylacetoacetate hydrolase family protein [Fimbriimonadaceae bacterium]
MKLCRFELAAAPGYPRVGIYHNGKVYETDGKNPLGIHEAADIQLLSPVKRPGSFRVYSNHQIDGIKSPLGFLDDLPIEEPVPTYSYRNPGAILGPGASVEYPSLTNDLSFEPLIVVVIQDDGHRLELGEAENLILGYALGIEFVARDLARFEASSITGHGQSRDFASLIGPVVVTPDDMQDLLRNDEDGVRMDLEMVARVNGRDVFHTNMIEANWSFAELLVNASQTGRLLSGDVFAVSMASENFSDQAPPRLEIGDEVQLSAPVLGTLKATVIAPVE